jgi:hypothetical protein
MMYRYRKEEPEDALIQIYGSWSLVMVNGEVEEVSLSLRSIFLSLT